MEGSEEKRSIEEDLSMIEEVIARLESGSLTLEESLEEFKKGVGLVREANERLGEAGKTLKLLQENGEINDF